MNRASDYTDCEAMLRRILPNSYAKNIQVALDTKFKALRSPQRSIRTLRRFLQFMLDTDASIEKTEELALLFHCYQEVELTARTHNSATTVEDDLRALRSTILALQASGAFPDGHIPKLKKLTVRSLFSDPDLNAPRVLGNFDIEKATFTNDEKPLALRLNIPPEEFLENLIKDIRRHRNTILHISRSYLREANCRLDFAKQAVKATPASTFIDSDNLSDQKSNFQQRYSLFNPKHFGLVAKQNMVAYVYHKHDGLMPKDDFKGRTHLYSFGGNTEMREHFGLSSLSAVAAQNIIVIESGINVDPLRNIELSSDGSLKDLFRITDDGFNIIYKKPRANSPRNKDMMFIDEHDINIEYALRYLLRATKLHRSKSPNELQKKLFIYDSVNTLHSITQVSPTAFKVGMKRLLIRAKEKLQQSPKWCKHVSIDDIDELLKHSPNASQLRVTEGVLRWYDSGGDPFAAANYLGNTESVALRNYVPIELQNVLYSQQIARFQNLLLAAATDKKTYQKAVLKLESERGSNTHYEQYIKELDELNPNWRQLKGRVDGRSKSNTGQAAALIMTEEHIAKLYNSFEQQQSTLINGRAIDERQSTLSNVFKNLVSYINVFGTGSQRRMLRNVIVKERQKNG